MNRRLVWTRVTHDVLDIGSLSKISSNARQGWTIYQVLRSMLSWSAPKRFLYRVSICLVILCWAVQQFSKNTWLRWISHQVRSVYGFWRTELKKTSEILTPIPQNDTLKFFNRRNVFWLFSIDSTKTIWYWSTWCPSILLVSCCAISQGQMQIRASCDIVDRTP